MKLSEKRALKKKEEILKSALAIVNEKGYDGATMEEIAAELLMTKGSIYYYFKNKEDLIFQCHHFVLSQAVRDIEEIIEKDIAILETLSQMVSVHIDYAINERQSFNLIVDPKKTYKEEHLEEVLKLRKYYAELFDETIQKGIDEGIFRVEEPKVARMFILGALNWIQQWVSENGRLSVAELKKLFTEYVLKILT